MKLKRIRHHTPGFSVEPLELRLAPASLLLASGDSASFGSDSVSVSGGQALVFSNDSNQITGIAVSNGAKLTIHGDVHGDIVTDLDSDGTLSDGVAANDGTLLLYSSISGLEVQGSVFGDVLAGNGITNVSVTGTVGFLATGTGVNIHGQVDFDGTGGDDALNFSLLNYQPAPGQAAGSITNVTIGTANGGGLDGMITGAGSASRFARPNDMVAADFNNDGSLDLVTVNTTLDNLLIFLGSTKGTFGSGTEFGAGLAPVALIAADFNTDGNLDLAVANRDGDNISIYFGNGRGAFPDRIDYTVGVAPSALVAADFNDDNFLDLAVTNGGSTSVSVLLGAADGAFGPASSYGVGVNPVAVVAGDFNDDSIPDLVTASGGSNSLTFLAGVGNGTFDIAEPTAAATGDFNNDNSADLVVANGNTDTLAIFTGTTSGTFNFVRLIATSSEPSALVVGQFDGDTNNDIIVVNTGSNTISLFAGNGNASFDAPLNFNVGAAPTAIVSGNFDADSNLDVAVTNSGDDSVFVMLNDGAGGFGLPNSFAVGDKPVAIISTDLNADAAPDLVIANELSETLTVLLGNGNGIFAPAAGSPIALGFTPTGLAAGNLDSGSTPDLAVVGFAGNTGKLGVLLGNGDGSFAAPMVTNVGDKLSAVVIGEFFPDGLNDLAVTDAANNSIAVMLGNGDGTFGSPTPYAVGTNPVALLAGSFNSGNVPDLLAVNHGDGTFSAIFGNNDGTFRGLTTTSSNITLSLGFTPTSLADTFPSGTQVDFNADGKLDLTVAGSSGNLAIALGNDDGTFTLQQPAPSSGTTGQFSDVVIADFNNDSKADLAAAVGSGTSVQVLLGNGDATFGPATSVAVGTAPRGLVVGSFNQKKDSALDLAVANNLGDTISVALGAVTGKKPPVPSGGFQTATSFDLLPPTDGSDGGSITKVTIVNDTGGYSLITGRGGDASGVHSNNGGALTSFTQKAGTGNVTMITGAGGTSNRGIADDGGSVSKLNMKGTGSVTLTTGAGGFGVGTGGDGGNITSVTIDNTNTGGFEKAISLSAGSGGIGQFGFGGNGGMVSKITVHGSENVTVGAGNGVLGVLGGGVSGDISSVTATAMGDLVVFSGDGGTGTGQNQGDNNNQSADGGAGGRVSKSTFEATGNVSVFTGAGGSGTGTGAAGGIATGLTLRSGDTARITTGSGAIGNNFGGNGGDITKITVLETKDLILIGGNGADGGSGGGFGANISGIEAVVSSGERSAIVGGAGGTGSNGGRGGSVSSVDITGDILAVIGGTGGDSGIVFPTFMLSADMDGDGKLDLLTVNSSSDSISILTGSGNGSFGKITTLGVSADTDSTESPQPVTAAVGDFNGDGRLDIAVANIGTDDLSIFISRGNSKFDDPFTIAVGANPDGIVATDLNNDGFVDLAVANHDSNSITILLGDGQGSFGQAATPASVTTGDFNNDTITDLLIANSNLDNVTLFLGNGNGGFSYSAGIQVGDGPSAVTTGDFDGDGKLDFAVANRSDHNLSILLGNNDGTFAAPVNYGVGNSPVALVAGNFGGSAGLDLAVANTGSNNVSVLINSGTGTFGAATNYGVGDNPDAITTGDFNDDGRLDLVVTNNGTTNTDMSVLLANATGGFNAAATTALPFNPLAVATGELNGDAILDLIVTGFSGTTGKMGVLLGQAGGTFTAPAVTNVGDSLSGVALANLNADTFLDVIATDSAFNQTQVLLGNGNGAFGAATGFAVGSGPVGLATGLFDASTNVDIAVINSGSNSFSVLLGDGTGAFGTAGNTIISSTGSTVAVGNGPLDVVAGDFTGDGIPDLATANDEADNISFLKGLGNGTFAAATNTALATGANPTDLTAADVNDDGKLDVVVSAYTETDTVRAGQIELFLGDGAGMFATPSVIAIANSGTPNQVVAVDITGDGKLDLAVVDPQVNTFVVLKGDDTGAFETYTGSTVYVARQPVSLVVADFNADNSLDVATADQIAGKASLSLNNGNGTFAGPTPVAIISVGTAGIGGSVSGITVTGNIGDYQDPDPVGSATGNFNSDAFADLVVISSTGEVSVFLGDDTGDFILSQSLEAGANPSAVIVADLTGDNRPEIAVANKGDDNISIFRNDGSGGFADPTNLNVGDSPTALVAGNFGGTVAPDLAVTVSGTNQVTILLNNGDGTFELAPVAVASGDLNGDSKLDLVVANSLGNNLNVFLGDGNGGFALHGAIATGERPSAVVIANFGGSPALDIAMVNRDDDNLMVFAGNGDGTFGAGTTFTVGDAPVALLAGNFGGDAALDLVAVNSGSDNISLLLNDGNGSFGTATNFSVGDNPVAITAAEFTGDATLDLAVANNTSRTITILPGNGMDGFGSGTTLLLNDTLNAIGSGLFNDDNAVDLVVAGFSGSAGRFTVLLGNGNGTFANPTVMDAGRRLTSLTVADFNGDGNSDVAATDSLSNEVEVLLGTGDGSFGAAPLTVGTSPSAIVAGLFNAGSAVDIVAINSGSDNFSVLLGHGDGNFEPAANQVVEGRSQFSAGADPIAVVAGDLNGDMKIDLVAAGSASTSLSVLLGNGKGAFDPPSAVTVGHSVRGLAIGVLDNGDTLDLVATGSGGGTGKLTVLPGNGDGTFGLPNTTDLGTSLGPVRLDTFDGNTSLDVAVINSGQVSVLLNNGDGTFGAANNLNAGVTPVDLVTGTFNAGTNKDIVVVSSGSQGIAALLGDGNGMFPTTVATRLTQYGFAFGRAGGLAAGLGGASSNVKVALAGDVTDIEAARIAAIVAGSNTPPDAANSVDKIVTTAAGISIGRDFNGNGKYDFIDQDPPGNGVPDLFDTPIDGLILAKAVGTINGETLNPMSPPDELLFALFVQDNLNPNDDVRVGDYEAH